MEHVQYAEGIDPEEVIPVIFWLQEPKQVQKELRIKRRVMIQYIHLHRLMGMKTGDQLYTIIARDRAYVSIKDIGNNN